MKLFLLFVSSALPSIAMIPHSKLLLPASFSSVSTTHATDLLQQDSTTALESVMKVLSGYRLQSHIEVVLVGEKFTSSMVNVLSSSLRELAEMAAKATPLQYTHEELVFHVTLGSGIRQQLQEVFDAGGRRIDPATLAPILEEYHVHASMTTTTIFILHSGVSGSYVYASKVPSCPQRAFLSKEGFAMIDLSAKFMSIRSILESIEHIVSPATFPFLDTTNSADNTLMQTSMHDLATLIHRSGEALVPFPIYGSDTALLRQGSSSSPSSPSSSSGGSKNNIQQSKSNQNGSRNVYAGTDVVILTLCLYEGTCDTDKDTEDAIRDLLREFAIGQVNDLGVVTYEVSVDTEPALAHALHAATSFPTNGDGTKVHLLTNELLYWLGSATTTRNILFKHGQQFVHDPGAPRIAKRRVLPVFVIKAADGVDLSLNQGQQAVSCHFPEPPGGWLDETKEKTFLPSKTISLESDWPTSAVVTIRGRSGTPLPGIRSGLSCGGVELSKTSEDYVGDLLSAVLSALYGLVPPHLHYSTSSKRIVADYLWAQPPAMRTLLQRQGDTGDGYSFREHRAISRHVLIHGTDSILSSFATTLMDLGAIRPAVNISSVLGLEHLITPIAGNTGFTKGTPINDPSKALFPLNSVTGTGEHGLLAAFLYHLDRSADSFAQLNYPLALLSMNNAHEVADDLREQADKIVQGRMGSIFCKDMRPQSVIHRINEGIRSESDTSTEQDILHTRKRNGQFWLCMILAMFVGSFLGFWRSGTKLESKKRGLD